MYIIVKFYKIHHKNYIKLPMIYSGKSLLQKHVFT